MIQRPFKPVVVFKKPIPKWLFFLWAYAVGVTVLVIFLLMEYYGG